MTDQLPKIDPAVKAQSRRIQKLAAALHAALEGEDDYVVCLAALNKVQADLIDELREQNTGGN